MFSINDVVLTPHGKGIIIGRDLPDTKLMRYIVKLDDDKRFAFNPCYFPKELKVIQGYK